MNQPHLARVFPQAAYLASHVAFQRTQRHRILVPERAGCSPSFSKISPKAIWLWVKTNGIPFWGRCTTHFRTYFSGNWDVRWAYGILAHGHLGRSVFGVKGQPIKGTVLVGWFERENKRTHIFLVCPSKKARLSFFYDRLCMKQNLNKCFSVCQASTLKNLTYLPLNRMTVVNLSEP